MDRGTAEIYLVPVLLLDHRAVNVHRKQKGARKENIHSPIHPRGKYLLNTVPTGTVKHRAPNRLHSGPCGAHGLPGKGDYKEKITK